MLVDVNLFKLVDHGFEVSKVFTPEKNEKDMFHFGMTGTGPSRAAAAENLIQTLCSDNQYELSNLEEIIDQIENDFMSEASDDEFSTNHEESYFVEILVQVDEPSFDTCYDPESVNHSNDEYKFNMLEKGYSFDLF